MSEKKIKLVPIEEEEEIQQSKSCLLGLAAGAAAVCAAVGAFCLAWKKFVK